MQLQSGAGGAFRPLCRDRSAARAPMGVPGGEPVVTERRVPERDLIPSPTSSARSSERLYMTGDLRALTGLPRTHMDFFLREGIIRPVTRTESGYLLFDDTELETLRAVLRWREEGVGISEIREPPRTAGAANDVIWKRRGGKAGHAGGERRLRTMTDRWSGHWSREARQRFWPALPDHGGMTKAGAPTPAFRPRDRL